MTGKRPKNNLPQGDSTLNKDGKRFPMTRLLSVSQRYHSWMPRAFVITYRLSWHVGYGIGTLTRAGSWIRANIIFCMNRRNRCGNRNRHQFPRNMVLLTLNAALSRTSFDSWLVTMTNLQRSQPRHFRLSRSGKLLLAHASLQRRHRTS